MEIADLVAYLREHRLGVLATAGDAGRPQAAAMGFAVTDQLEVLFDTLRSSRKYVNLAQNPRVAVVVWEGETTVQLEGLARELDGDELARLQASYFQAFPDGPGRLSWPGITYFAIRPTWVRFADYGGAPPQIEEWSFPPSGEWPRR